MRRFGRAWLLRGVLASGDLVIDDILPVLEWLPALSASLICALFAVRTAVRRPNHGKFCGDRWRSGGFCSGYVAGAVRARLRAAAGRVAAASRRRLRLRLGSSLVCASAVPMRFQAIAAAAAGRVTRYARSRRRPTTRVPRLNGSSPAAGATP